MPLHCRTKNANIWKNKCLGLIRDALRGVRGHFHRFLVDCQRFLKFKKFKIERSTRIRLKYINYTFKDSYNTHRIHNKNHMHFQYFLVFPSTQDKQRWSKKKGVCTTWLDVACRSRARSGRASRPWVLNAWGHVRALVDCDRAHWTQCTTWLSKKKRYIIKYVYSFFGRPGSGSGSGPGSRSGPGPFVAAARCAAALSSPGPDPDPGPDPGRPKKLHTYTPSFLLTTTNTTTTATTTTATNYCYGKNLIDVDQDRSENIPKSRVNAICKHLRASQLSQTFNSVCTPRLTSWNDCSVFNGMQ